MSLDGPLGGGLEAAHRAFSALDRAMRALVPADMNPFAQTGAITTLTFLVAAVSGVIELLWYESSVHTAYLSVEQMSSAPWTAGLVRSLHRYSSDACMLFATLHAAKLFAQKRFHGPRWLAWTTGFLLLGLLWLVGWLGYWLVWDERATAVAISSARMADLVPIFTEPLSRSFLTNESVNSLLFFMIFFLHMLIPLAMGVLIWIHILRVSRSRFLTDGTMSAWVVGALIALSLILPATSAGPAELQTAPSGLTLDWWYLLPLVLTERVSALPLWGIVLGIGAVGLAIPWLLKPRKSDTAVVVPRRCNACRTCYEDCPYDAISIVPRPKGEDLERHELVAAVNPALCVGCGVCSASCDTAGIGIEHIERLAVQKTIDDWLKVEATHIAFLCAESLSKLDVDGEGRSEELPGCRVVEVPCIGWVHAKTVERALRRGALGVLLAGCGEGACAYREGAEWAQERMSGVRKPAVRPEKFDLARVRLVRIDAGGRRELMRQAAAFRAGEKASTRGPRVPVLFGGVVVVTLCAAITFVFSDLPLPFPAQEPAIWVSFHHPGERGEHCRELTPEEIAARPVHMRQTKVCERGRAPVRLRVTIDEQERLSRAYPPGGFSGDNPSHSVEKFEVSPGEHRVRVELGDSWDPGEWRASSEKTITADAAERRVILYDKREGFKWH